MALTFGMCKKTLIPKRASFEGHGGRGWEGAGGQDSTGGAERVSTRRDGLVRYGRGGARAHVPGASGAPAS